ncbi:hypothetical protein INR49_022782, partial [Caranx melampygus]
CFRFLSRCVWVPGSRRRHLELRLYRTLWGRWHLRREGGGGRDGGRHIETLTSKIFSGAAE